MCENLQLAAGIKGFLLLLPFVITNVSLPHFSHFSRLTVLRMKSQ